MAAPVPPDPVVMIDDLVGEFLVRLPPEDPAVLARAALVSRQWHRVITSPAFRRKFREFRRRSPPLLGYLETVDDESIRFVPTSSFRPRHGVRRDVLRAIHASHGRVLLQRWAGFDVLLSVWDPITDEQRDLPELLMWELIRPAVSWDAPWCAPLLPPWETAAATMNFSCFYSSETDSWSDLACEQNFTMVKMVGNCVLVGSALYIRSRGGILMHDLLTHQMSAISVLNRGMLIATELGKLGAADAWNSKICLSSLMEDGRWGESCRDIELRTLLPDDALCENSRPYVAGFAEIGASVIFLWTRVGYFTIDLNSGKSKKVGESFEQGDGFIVPYVSFCTSAPGAVSTDEGPGAGVAVSTYEGSRAGVAVSTDEGPGNGVVVSTNEGPGAGMCQVHKKLKL